MPNTNYDTDFYGWANEQASLLRAGQFSAADMENIAEEIESMGSSQRKELRSRLVVLLLHLLKWQLQPKGRCSSWETSIRVQRNDLAIHIRYNPSLKPQVPDAILSAYENAQLLAAEETKLPNSMFPGECPYSFEQIMDRDFFPQ